MVSDYIIKLRVFLWAFFLRVKIHFGVFRKVKIVISMN